MAKNEADIDIQVAPAFAELVPVARLERAVAAALQHEEHTAQVTVVVTDDEGIQELNRDFMGEDEPTDVLSFGAQEDAVPFFVAAPESGSYLGDVIISYPRAVAQAFEQEHPVERELDLLVVHGVLHLLGYDHAEPEDRAAMWARQDAILAGL